jgi:5-hydroxyisourate hydrolase-like protein (transthyretin family)
MDISKLKPLERTIEILNPATDTPLGIRVKLMSIEDERLKKLKRVFTDAHLKRDSKNKAIKSDELESNGNMLLFTASLGWEWYNPTGNKGDQGFDPEAMPDWKGAVPEYNQRNFIEVLVEFPQFANQIQEAIDETKAFFDNSKRS